MLNWIVWNRSVYMNKNESVINYWQWLMCHKTKPIKPNPTYQGSHRTWQQYWKLATVVDSDPIATFSIAITSRCREGRYSFPWITPLYSWSLPYNAECLASRYQVPFWVFDMTEPGIKPQSPGQLANILSTTSMSLLNVIHVSFRLILGTKVWYSLYSPSSFTKMMLA